MVHAIVERVVSDEHGHPTRPTGWIEAPRNKLQGTRLVRRAAIFEVYGGQTVFIRSRSHALAKHVHGVAARRLYAERNLKTSPRSFGVRLARSAMRPTVSSQSRGLGGTRQ